MDVRLTLLMDSYSMDRMIGAISRLQHKQGDDRIVRRIPSGLRSRNNYTALFVFL